MNPSRLLILPFFALMLLSAAAQDIQKVLPKNLPNQEQGNIRNPTSEQLEGGEKVLIPRLSGITFIAGPDINKNGIPFFYGIRAERLPFLQDPQFLARIEKEFLGKPLTVDGINKLTRAVVEQYSLNDRPVVTAIAPEQNVSDNTLQISIIEGHVHEVKSEGNKWFSDKIFTKGLDIKKGDPISEKKLVNNLNDLNKNPFHTTDAELVQGSEAGTTDILLKNHDRFPLRVYAGYENNGNQVTGMDRWNYGFNYGNFLGLDQQFNYQFTGSSDYEQFRAHAASYIIPLPWHHTLTLFGGYIDSEGSPSGTTLKGYSWQSSARYTIPLPTIKDYIQNLNLGYDYKESNNNLEFGGQKVYNSMTAISQFDIGYDGRLKDDFGSTTFKADLYLSPGDMTDHNDTSSFQVARANAHSDYAYGQIGITRVTRLPEDFSWIVRGLYQVSSTNLLGSEQFGLGGADTVRGYLEREANGDTGWLVSTEIHTPAISIGDLLVSSPGKNIAKDRLEFLGFVDYGWVRNNNLLVGEAHNTFLLSVGPGVRYSLSQYISFKLDYGFQLTDPGLGDPCASRGEISMTMGY